MSTKQQIEKMLNDAFSPRFLEVIDVSDAHYGHAAANPEGESHFEVNIISDAFAAIIGKRWGKNKIFNGQPE